MKFNIRKKLVTLAVASAVSGGAMLAAAPAHAMNVSQNNVGQVLLFPYYTVKNGFDTIFTVTNTSDKTAIFKIRFREALNSREVLDFNVILSPFDHWSGAVTEDAAGTGALVRTFDKTCTSPDKPKWIANGAGFDAPMFTDLFSNQYADGVSAANNVGRVKEGYFEVILMGVSTADTADSANTVEYNAKHVAGVPRDCALVDAALADNTTISANFSGFTEPENILKGHVIYIDVDTGKAIDAEPTAIEDWRTGGGHIVAPANDATPSLANGDPAADIHQLVNGWNVTTSVVGSSEHAVSMLLMSNAVINEFATGTGAATSWVLTFPTKHFYTDFYTSPAGTVTNTPVINQPFSYAFSGDTDGTGMSCDTVTISYVNREEGPDEQESGTGFSGQGGTVTQPKQLCYEVNVLDFNGSSVFGSGVNRLPVDTSAAGTAGWAAVKLNVTTDGGTGLQSFTGLPAIGFAATMRDAGGATVNYGSSTAHSYESGALIPTP